MLFLQLDIQRFAQKKGQSSTKNNRDSAGRRLGAKLSDGQLATAGAIIYRQEVLRYIQGKCWNRKRSYFIC